MATPSMKKLMDIAIPFAFSKQRKASSLEPSHHASGKNRSCTTIKLMRPKPVFFFGFRTKISLRLKDLI